MGLQREWMSRPWWKYWIGWHLLLGAIVGGLLGLLVGWLA